MMREWLLEVGIEMGYRPDSQVCDALPQTVPELAERDAAVSTYETGAVVALWAEAPDALAAQDDARHVVDLIAAKATGFVVSVQVRSMDVVEAEDRPTDQSHQAPSRRPQQCRSPSLSTRPATTRVDIPAR